MHFVCFELNDHVPTSSEAVIFLKRKVREGESLIEIVTENGRKIVATEDHPIFTKEGFKVASKIKRGDEIAVYGFEGVKYEEPKKIVIVSENKIESKQVRKILKEKNLLPLTLNNPKIGILARIVGYALGDSHIQEIYEKKKNGKRIRGWRRN